MICKKCGFTNKSDDKFCGNCGAKLEESQPAQSVKGGTTVLSGTTDFYQMSSAQHASPRLSSPIWYFAEDSVTQGPYTKEQISDLIRSGRVQHATYIWREGFDDWKPLHQTELQHLTTQENRMNSTSQMDGSQNHSPILQNEQKQWFYSQNGQSMGPFSDADMQSFIEQGVISLDTYVWKNGMQDWKLYRDVFGAPAGLLSGNAPYPVPVNQNISTTAGIQPAQTQNNSVPTPSYGNSGLETKSIAMCLLLSFITCGVYYFIWIYKIADTINRLAARDRQEGGASPIAAVLFTLFSCGIYQIYFYWKEESTVTRLKSAWNQDNSNTVLVVILGIFFPIAALCILQDQVNSLIKAG